jgi:hypothetical protein
MLRYEEGPHAGIEVNLLIEEDGASPGPTDMFFLQSPYRGRTKQGIGIGSSLEDVKNAYGKPDGTFGSEYVIYTYCFDGSIPTVLMGGTSTWELRQIPSRV